jgi:hypothetical protein
MGNNAKKETGEQKAQSQSSGRVAETGNRKHKKKPGNFGQIFNRRANCHEGYSCEA